MPTALRDVRSQEQSGKHLLAVSFSVFDPSRTFWGGQLQWISLRLGAVQPNRLLPESGDRSKLLTIHATIGAGGAADLGRPVELEIDDFPKMED
jgi:hypothetical protein